ncbi:MAG: hypothetical protein NHB15_06540 [Methanosarcina barkeri]|nr:hypothetical protein [Methanosarcina sp. ERenArc_MAG2]MCO5381782.1 hypothetical protein [Methanosarcina sp. ERenArc_MAG2]
MSKTKQTNENTQVSTLNKRFSDFEVWRIQEDPEDCSRGDIKRACRLGGLFNDG